MTHQLGGALGERGHRRGEALLGPVGFPARLAHEVVGGPDAGPPELGPHPLVERPDRKPAAPGDAAHRLEHRREAVEMPVHVHVRRRTAEQILGPGQLGLGLLGHHVRRERAHQRLVERAGAQQRRREALRDRRAPRQVQVQPHGETPGERGAVLGVGQVHHEGRGGHHPAAHREHDALAHRRVVAQVVGVDDQSARRGGHGWHSAM